MPGSKNNYRYRLAVIGDSMAQGFQNGGIYRTDLSFPSMLSRCFDPPIQFEVPSFIAQAGIPLNLEVLVRGLSDEYGDSITGWRDHISATLYLYRTLKRIKNHWEGNRTDLKIERDTPYQNQAVWGFAANDAWMLTDHLCKRFIKENRPNYSVFNVLPDQAMYITGRMVLNPGFRPELEERNQIDNIRQLHENGGVDNLIVCIGHNNFVGATSALKIIYSSNEDMEAHHFQRNYTVSRPDHFRLEMQNLFQRIAKLKIPRVFVPTYPYVTIPPAIRGVNDPGKKHEGGYFDYYTRFWIWDEDFDPDKHPFLLKQQAIELDQLIDQYNLIIRTLANEFGFHVVPVHKHVNAVARRRLGVETVRPYPPQFIQALKRNPATAYLVTEDGKSRLSTDYLRTSEKDNKLIQGGIFSLDGLHPTTIGYGLVANIYKMSMEEAGVRFEKDIDWDMIISNDTLVTDPPHMLAELRLLLRFLSMGREEKFNTMGNSLMQHMFDLFSRRR